MELLPWVRVNVPTAKLPCIKNNNKRQIKGKYN